MSLHRETFTALVKEQGWTQGAELGVDKGILFGMLLRECPKLEQLTGVDLFPDRHRSRRAFEYAAAYPTRARLIEESTGFAHLQVYDSSLDFVFIDADHSEAAVTADIANWRSKVRAGGWLGGHDYSRKFPGVIAAVQKAFPKGVQFWPGNIWGVWL